MSATCPPGRLADVGPERLAGPPAVCPVLPQIRTSLELFRDSLLDLSRRLERPILEVGAFLEAIQELESGKPTAEAGSRLVVALQSYDLFHQKVQLAEHLIELLMTAMADCEIQQPVLSGSTLLADTDSLCFHLTGAHELIDNAANEIPFALSQVLLREGASGRRFRHWGINRSLDELAKLNAELGQTSYRAELLRRSLAEALGRDPGERHTAPPPEADFEDSSIMLF